MNPCTRSACFLLLSACIGSALSIDAPADRRVAYALRRLESSLRDAHGLSLNVIAGESTLGPDGFAIRREGGAIVIAGGDERGAMYGNRMPMPHNAGETFSWARFLVDGERDMLIAKGEANAPEPPPQIRH